MNKKYLILSLISIIFLLAIASVCAQENTTEDVKIANDESEIILKDASREDIDIYSDSEVLSSPDDSEIIANDDDLSDASTGGEIAKTYNISGHTVNLMKSDYDLLKEAKENRTYKGIIGIKTGDYHTEKVKQAAYKNVKKTITKKLLICKITGTKNGVKEKWTKNWKAKTKKYIKKGYKITVKKSVKKTSGKIWYIMKKTTTKKVKYYKNVSKKYEIKATVETIPKDGVDIKAGDYVSLYTSNGPLIINQAIEL